MKVKFSFDDFSEIALAENDTFAKHMKQVGQNDDAYWFLDKGSSVLAVAHLDSVEQRKRWARHVQLPHEHLVFSPVLDDRLGVYVICSLLPKLGIDTDILLTTGEEQGASTAMLFETEKQYNWMFQFDRSGTDVVMYQYDNATTRQMMRDAGFRVGVGTFSDISVLGHLHCCGFNFGTAYYDYHSVNAFARIGELMTNVRKFAGFYKRWNTTYIPYTDRLDERFTLDDRREYLDEMRTRYGIIDGTGFPDGYNYNHHMRCADDDTEHEWIPADCPNCGAQIMIDLAHPDGASCYNCGLLVDEEELG